MAFFQLKLALNYTFALKNGRKNFFQKSSLTIVAHVFAVILVYSEQLLDRPLKMRLHYSVPQSKNLFENPASSQQLRPILHAYGLAVYQTRGLDDGNVFQL